MLQNIIFDENFVKIGLLDNYNYCQYKEDLYESGTFTIRCPSTKKNIDLLKQNRIVWLENDVAGIVQYIHIRDAEKEDVIEVSGSLLKVLLDWRYIYPIFNAENKYAENIMEEVVDKNCINTSKIERRYNSLIIDKVNPNIEYGKISKQKTGGSVLEFLSEFGKAVNLGSKVGFYPREKKYKFKVIQGIDRTLNNPYNNKRVIFSEEMNNIVSATYVNNQQDYRNSVIVDGEEKDGKRRSLEVFVDGEELAGFYRRELYVDARDIQSEITDSDGNEKTLSENEYNALLNTRGVEKLGECEKEECIESKVRSDIGSNYAYRRDYNLGDKVTVVKESLGYYSDAIISSVTVTQDKNTYTIEPIFGNAIPTLYSKLKRKGVVV